MMIGKFVSPLDTLRERRRRWWFGNRFFAEDGERIGFGHLVSFGF